MMNCLNSLSGDAAFRFSALCSKCTKRGCRRFKIRERLHLAHLFLDTASIPAEITVLEDGDIECSEFRQSTRGFNSKSSAKKAAEASKKGQMSIFQIKTR